jgi:HlyD family secretion protein
MHMTLNPLATLANPSPDAAAPRRRIPKWGLFLLVLPIGGGGFALHRQLFAPPPPMSMEVPIERTELAVTLSANGTVEPDKVVNVSPKNAGIMKRLLVKEGDVVNEGQVLAHMDGSNLEGQLIQEQGRLAKAEANLNKLIAGSRTQEVAQAVARVEETQATVNKLMAGNRSQDVAQANARLDNAQATLTRTADDLSRFQSLYNSGAVSRQLLNQKQSDRDQAQAQFTEMQQALSLQKAGTRSEDIDQAQAQLKQQQQALELLQAGTRVEDIDQARAEVTTAQGALKSVQTQKEDTFIRAPFSGTVISKYAEPGAFVTPMTSGSSVSSATSSSILSLASTNQVAASVPESSIAQIRVGQSVVIKADAHPGKTFQGRVKQIASEATVKQNVTSFKVEVAIVSDGEKLLHSGMNVAVEFSVGQLENVITVPTVAVTRQQEVTGVFVSNGTNKPPIFTPITTGATVNNKTEVKSGLTGTEKVLIKLPPKPKPAGGFSFPGLSGNDKPDGPPPGGPPKGPGGPPGGGKSGGPPP